MRARVRLPCVVMVFSSCWWWQCVERAAAAAAVGACPPCASPQSYALVQWSLCFSTKLCPRPCSRLGIRTWECHRRFSVPVLSAVLARSIQYKKIIGICEACSSDFFSPYIFDLPHNVTSGSSQFTSIDVPHFLEVE